jgi:hypothetical protein
VRPDSRNMFSALVAMESAAVCAALVAGGRFADFVLTEAEAAAAGTAAALRAPAGHRQRAWEAAAEAWWRLDLEAARMAAGLPRTWALLFLAELDQSRGSRPAPPIPPG